MQRKNILLIIAAILLLILIGILIINKASDAAPVAVNETPAAVQPAPASAVVPITITEQTIKEQYYSGTKPVISGSSALAKAAQSYINTTVQKFAADAQAEVPSRIKEYGAENPTSSYTIDLNAKQVSSATTDSIIIDEYIYMGGANGSSSYKVLTASKGTGELLSLSTIIKKESQPAFTAMVKKELLAKYPDTFPEEIQKLNMQSFDDWSLDQNGTLTLYFDKYQIGPGALGAVAFPLPKAKTASYFAPEAL
jgi:hypothetical protein